MHTIYVHTWYYCNGNAACSCCRTAAAAAPVVEMHVHERCAGAAAVVVRHRVRMMQFVGVVY